MAIFIFTFISYVSWTSQKVYIFNQQYNCMGRKLLKKQSPMIYHYNFFKKRKLLWYPMRFFPCHKRKFLSLFLRIQMIIELFLPDIELTIKCFTGAYFCPFLFSNIKICLVWRWPRTPYNKNMKNIKKHKKTMEKSKKIGSN